MDGDSRGPDNTRVRVMWIAIGVVALVTLYLLIW